MMCALRCELSCVEGAQDSAEARAGWVCPGIVLSPGLPQSSGSERCRCWLELCDSQQKCFQANSALSCQVLWLLCGAWGTVSCRWRTGGARQNQVLRRCCWRLPDL
mmetsp:Transcript_89261/g.239162  ORF Transcript_89261/g.239162 Transcript_89261/m.239162 type:complete len:106 (-) Transcript_89261:14-331(-)